jgi:hypothetical protein
MFESESKQNILLFNTICFVFKIGPQKFQFIFYDLISRINFFNHILNLLVYEQSLQCFGIRKVFHLRLKNVK